MARRVYQTSILADDGSSSICGFLENLWSEHLLLVNLP